MQFWLQCAEKPARGQPALFRNPFRETDSLSHEIAMLAVKQGV